MPTITCGLLAVIVSPTCRLSSLAARRTYGWKENPLHGYPQFAPPSAGHHQPERGSADDWSELAHHSPLSGLGCAAWAAGSVPAAAGGATTARRHHLYTRATAPDRLFVGTLSRVCAAIARRWGRWHRHPPAPPRTGLYRHALVALPLSAPTPPTHTGYARAD